MKIIVTLPTYNESENIEPLIDDILCLREDLEIVVVDDDSPDGTWKIVQKIMEQNPRVHLVHRTKERGRGSAGIEGFRYAMQAGADWIVEMDADYSHHPRFIPTLLAAAENADVAIGSRLIPGGGEQGRSWMRQWITRIGNLYAQMVLGVSVRDCTSGYRVFRRRVFERVNLERLTSNGPAIVQEVLMACKAEKLSFVEVPILFEERQAGRSTFNWKILLHGMLAVWKFRFRKWNKN